MSDPAARYAVVADEAAMAAMLGVSHSPWVGVCVVNGDTASCHVLEGRSGLQTLLGDIPRCPSLRGGPTAYPDFASEMEALSMITDEALAHRARSRQAAFPEGFASALPRMAGGLSARMSDYGLDLSVSLALAAALGWREGDRVAMGVSSCGRLLAVAPGGDGAELVRDVSDPEILHLDRDLSGVPLHVPLIRTEWQSPEYQVLGSCVVLAPPTVAEARPAPVAETLPGAHLRQTIPAVRSRPMPRVLSALLAGICGAAAAAFLHAVDWL